jgi:hypothetical protein
MFFPLALSINLCLPLPTNLPLSTDVSDVLAMGVCVWVQVFFL